MIIISGPSTVGKNPFIYEVCNRYNNFEYVTPYTTREKRIEEVEGYDYFFLSKEEFHTKIKDKIFTEWDYCLDNYYGYASHFPGTKSQITHGLSRMALRIKEKHPSDVTTVFLMPLDLERIYYNLKQIYSGRALELRKALVEEEICHSVLFDNVFFCGDSIYSLFENHEIQKLFNT